MPIKTQRITQWALKVWRDWATFSKSVVTDDEKEHDPNENFVVMDRCDPNFWLC